MSSTAASRPLSRASASPSSSRIAGPTTSQPRSASMSSSIIATSASSSTTRIRFPASALMPAANPSCEGEGEAPGEAFRRILRVHRPAELARRHPQQPRAEPFALRRGGRRDPRAPATPSARPGRERAALGRPAELTAAAGDGKRAVIRRVGRELVEHHAQRQRRRAAGGEQDRRARPHASRAGSPRVGQRARSLSDGAFRSAASHRVAGEKRLGGC